jgi:hypothetical protein
MLGEDSLGAWPCRNDDLAVSAASRIEGISPRAQAQESDCDNGCKYGAEFGDGDIQNGQRCKRKESL